MHMLARVVIATPDRACGWAVSVSALHLQACTTLLYERVMNACDTFLEDQQRAAEVLATSLPALLEADASMRHPLSSSSHKPSIWAPFLLGLSKGSAVCLYWAAHAYVCVRTRRRSWAAEHPPRA